MPRFGPDAATSVLLPPWKPAGQVSQEDALTAALNGTVPPGMNGAAVSGKRKAPKTFRAPGDRTGTALTGGQIITGDDGRSWTFHTVGRSTLPRATSAGQVVGGTAPLADALYTSGILSEADWCGSLERSLRRGLARWVNEEKGAARWRILPAPLSLVYTDDAPAYSTGVRLARWREHFKARPDRPVGFFGLRFQSQPRPVHVRATTERLERAWPGMGFGLLNLIENAFVTSVQGYGFGWGARLASRWGDLAAMDDTFGMGGNLGWAEMPGEPGTQERHEYDEYRFAEAVPKAAGSTQFQLERLQRAASEASQVHPDLAPVLEAALALWKACRRSGTSFYTLNHCRFLSWQMTDAVRGRALEQLQIERLDRAPVVYTVWDSGNDVMTRLVDDYTELCRTSMQYTDLTWMHAFQVGHAGHEPEEARRQLAAHERLVRKTLKKHPEALAFRDPDYQPKPMPDGSLAHAVEALDIVMDILAALDRLLGLLHSPETLAEQARMEQ